MDNEWAGIPWWCILRVISCIALPGTPARVICCWRARTRAASLFHLTVEDFGDDVNLSLSKTASADALSLRHRDERKRERRERGGRAGHDGRIQRGESGDFVALVGERRKHGQLMGDFYKRWADGAGKVEKVEALRQAQLDLLLGKARVQGDGSNRGVETEGPAPAGYAHPYYWAAFVLMGNWR